MTKDEKNTILTENSDFIHYFIHKYYHNFDEYHEDMYQEASVAILDVLDKYSSEKGTLSTFLTPYLNGCFSRYIAHNLFHISVYYYHTRAKILKCISVSDNNGTPSTIEEIAQNTGLSEATIKNSFTNLFSSSPISLESSEVANYTIKTDIIGDEHFDILYNVLEQLDTTDQQIIKYRFGLDSYPQIPAEEIAKRLHMSKPEVTRRLKDCKYKLKENPVLKKVYESKK